MKGDLYTARWLLLNDYQVQGKPLESLLDLLRPELGPEPGYSGEDHSDGDGGHFDQDAGIPGDGSLSDAKWLEAISNFVPGRSDLVVLKWRHDTSFFPVVGQRFSPEGFLDYLRKIGKPTSWRPEGVTIHSTSAPNLAQRPNGFESRHMTYLRDYYRGLNWSSGPHLFVDDNGIWVFSPLALRGTHSPSFNFTRFGIEQLGDYDSADDPKSERGSRVVRNAQFAAAALLKVFGLGSGKLNFHRFDQETTHRNCPGKKFKFAEYEAAMIEIYDAIPESFVL